VGVGTRIKGWYQRDRQSWKYNAGYQAQYKDGISKYALPKEQMQCP
jgi:hypothetical protein